MLPAIDNNTVHIVRFCIAESQFQQSLTEQERSSWAKGKPFLFWKKMKAHGQIITRLI